MYRNTFDAKNTRRCADGYSPSSCWVSGCQGSLDGEGELDLRGVLRGKCIRVNPVLFKHILASILFYSSIYQYGYTYVALWKMQNTWWSSIELLRALVREPGAIASAATTNMPPFSDTAR